MSFYDKILNVIKTDIPTFDNLNRHTKNVIIKDYKDRFRMKKKPIYIQYLVKEYPVTDCYHYIYLFSKEFMTNELNQYPEEDEKFIYCLLRNVESNSVFATTPVAMSKIGLDECTNRLYNFTKTLIYNIANQQLGYEGLEIDMTSLSLEWVIKTFQ